LEKKILDRILTKGLKILYFCFPTSLDIGEKSMGFLGPFLKPLNQVLSISEVLWSAWEL